MDRGYSFEEQPELFESWNLATDVKKPRSLLVPNTTVTLRLGYEHVVLIVVGLLMGVLASFALGLDRGQQEGAQRLADEPRRLELQRPPIAPSKERPAPSQPTETHVATAMHTSPSNLAKQPVNRYVIQIASYRKSSDATAEATKLKRAGYPVVTTATKGSFTVVFVGSYRSKIEAANQLPAFRKQYRDCFVKELPHESTS